MVSSRRCAASGQAANQSAASTAGARRPSELMTTPVAIETAVREEDSPAARPVAPPARSRPGAERLIALDSFRGMSIAGMLLVNNPGTWGAIYPPLEHAPWHGWTPTDLIFPFFVFIVGVTTHLSLSARARRGDPPGAITAQVVRRGLLIVLLGLLLQAFPYVPLTRITQLRFPGVLQRIGACSLVAAAVARRRGRVARRPLLRMLGAAGPGAPARRRGAAQVLQRPVSEEEDGD